MPVLQDPLGAGSDARGDDEPVRAPKKPSRSRVGALSSKRSQIALRPYVSAATDGLFTLQLALPTILFLYSEGRLGWESCRLLAGYGTSGLSLLDW